MYKQKASVNLDLSESITHSQQKDHKVQSLKSPEVAIGGAGSAR